MAEEQKQQIEGGVEEVQVQDRGLFDHFTKKDEEVQEQQVLVSEMEKVHVVDEEPKKSEDEEKKPGLLEKLHRSHSSSSSSVSFIYM